MIGGARVMGLATISEWTERLRGRRPAPFHRGDESLARGAHAAGGDPNDEALMARVAHGDEEAFAALVTRYERWARTVAGRALKNFDEADDLVQDAFLKVWVNGPQWQPRGTFKNYLLVILTRQCLDFLRRKRPIIMEEPPEMIEHRPSPREVASRRETSERLASRIDNLPERQRLAIMLVYGEDMSQKEAARAMEISPKAFESLLIRARAGLKQMLEEDPI
jgi:RNA polymerase sigma-70 factor (ECF subfamily)